MATSLAGGYTVCGARARGATRATLSPATGSCQGDQSKSASKSASGETVATYIWRVQKLNTFMRVCTYHLPQHTATKTPIILFHLSIFKLFSAFSSTRHYPLFLETVLCGCGYSEQCFPFTPGISRDFDIVCFDSENQYGFTWDFDCLILISL